MIRRPPRSTRVRSSAASDVYKRQLKRPAKGSKQAQLLEALVTRPAELLQLGQDSLARRLDHPTGARTKKLLTLRVEPKVELLLESDRAQQPQGIVVEDAFGDGLQPPLGKIAPPVERIDDLAPGERLGDRIDGEVAQRQILGQRSAQRREIDTLAAGERNPPSAVTFGEGKGCAAALLRESARRLPRIEADDVE